MPCLDVASGVKLDRFWLLEGSRSEADPRDSTTHRHSHGHSHGHRRLTGKMALWDTEWGGADGLA